MAFTLCPDGGPNRIWRFVAELPGNLLCTLDPDTNVLTIDIEKFSVLTPMQKRSVERTHALEIRIGVSGAGEYEIAA